jgi:sugar phosphate isomerase/epimerase
MTWRLGLATGACTHRSILDVLPLIRAVGIAGVEIGTPPQHFDPSDHDQIVAVRRQLDLLPLVAISIHAPFGGAQDLADPDPLRRRGAIDAVLTAGAAIKRLGGSLVVVHPSDLVRHGHDVSARLANSAACLSEIAGACRHEGVTLVIESPLPHLIGGHPEEFRWLLGRLDGTVRVCLDTGHTFLGGHWHAFMNLADGRLAHLHANDNHGVYDDHLTPGDGRIDWAEIVRTLMAVEFSGWAMLELRCVGEKPGASFARALARAQSLLGG